MRMNPSVLTPPELPPRMAPLDHMLGEISHAATLLRAEGERAGTGPGTGEWAPVRLEAVSDETIAAASQRLADSFAWVNDEQCALRSAFGAALAAETAAKLLGRPPETAGTGGTADAALAATVLVRGTLVGHPRGSVDPVQWVYHTATVMRSASSGGLVVIDPLMSENPVPFEAWTGKLANLDPASGEQTAIRPGQVQVHPGLDPAGIGRSQASHVHIPEAADVLKDHTRAAHEASAGRTAS